MDQREVELNVMAYCLTGDSALYDIREKGVSLSSFSSQPKVFEFVTAHLQEYGHLPTVDTVESVFGLKLPKKPDAGYCIDKLLDSELRREAEVALAEGIEMLSSEAKTEKGVEFLLSRLGRIKKVGKFSFGYTDGDALARLDALEKRKQLEKLKGSLFDLPIKRIPPGSLIGIVGRLGVGKSYYLLKLLLSAYHHGKKVLLISPEMTKEEFEIRWDAMTSRGVFSPEALLAGIVPREAYKEWLEQVAHRKEWITMSSHYGNPFTVGSIAALISEHNPDVVGVDGLPLISADDGEGGWEGIKSVSYGLQSLCVSRNIHILVATQATRDAANATVPELHQIAYGDGFAQACSIVLALGYHQREDKRYLAITKNRFGKAVRPVEVEYKPEEGIIG